MSHVSGLRAELSTYNTSPLSLSLHEGTVCGRGEGAVVGRKKHTRKEKNIWLTDTLRKYVGVLLQSRSIVILT